MPAEIEAQKLAYFPMPKAVCTAVKQAIHHINFGHYHEAKAGRHIHNAVYPTLNFLEINTAKYVDWTRITVIRDPIERLLSAYWSRVMDHRELSEEKIDMDLARQLMIEPDPSADEFFLNIDKYRILDVSIRHHTDYATTFLGYDLSFYHHVFNVDRLDELFKLLSEKTGQEVKGVREHASSRKISFFDIGPRARQALKEYSYPEYALMKEYYRPP